jgi:hypothetical protein
VDELNAVRLKIGRAHEHLHALHIAIQGFMWRQPYNSVGHLDREASTYVVRLVVREQPPPEWGPLFGDFISNLRSALDLLAVSLVEKAGKKPSTSTAFPIVDKDPDRPEAQPREKQAWASRVAGMSSDEVAAIRTLQPFNNPTPPYLVDTLVALRELSNRDKHRGLTPMIGVKGDISNFEVRKVQDCELAPVAGTRLYRPLEHGAEVARFPVTITGPDPDVDVRVQVPVAVSVDVPPIPPGTPIDEVLANVSTRVLEIVNDFERRFFS